MLSADLNRALVDIRAIRRKVAEGTEFRGYGPFTLVVTALVALLAGFGQQRWLPQPEEHAPMYVMFWLSVAAVCAALIATEMLRRARRLHSALADEMISVAVLQFLPAGIAGLLVPLVLLRAAPDLVWLLPSLWQIIFSLGVFACCRSLPRRMLLAGAWFLLCGTASLAVGKQFALSPFSMAGPFSCGMALVALIHARANRKAVADGE